MLSASDAPVKIAVLVSGGGTNLQALIDAQGSGALQSGRLALVVSDRPEVHALARAACHGIPSRVLDRKALGQSVFEAELLALLRASDIELIVLAGFLSILSGTFVSHYPERILNIHPSLIPSFCGKGYYGLKVHRAALDYGVKLTGATVHFVNEVPDGGEILLQRAVDVREGDTPETLQQRVMREAEQVLLPEAAELVCRTILERKGESS